MNPRLAPAMLFAAAVSAGCGLGLNLTPCKPFSSAPVMVCGPSSGTSMRATIFLTTSDAKCAVAADPDAGVLSVILSGTDCTVPSNNPVVPITNVTCDLSSAPAGTYSLHTTPSGPDMVVSLPLSTADSGIDPCF